MKKIIALFLAALMLVAFVGCEKDIDELEPFSVVEREAVSLPSEDIQINYPD